MFLAYSGLISFRMDWLDLLAVQGTLKSLFQHHSSKATILWCSAFFTVQLSHPYMTTGKIIALSIRKDTCSLEESYDQPRQHIKKQRYYLTNKGPYSQSYGFSSSHVWMWKLDCKESWASKNWCFWTVVLEKTLENPLDCKEIKPVNPKEISPEYSVERLMLTLRF